MQLFTQLKIGELPATRPVETVKEPVKETIAVKEPTAASASPLVSRGHGGGQRSAGKGLLIAGAGVAVVGGVLAGIGAGIGYGQDLNQKNVPPEKLETVVTARTLTTVGFVALGVGGAAAVIGAVLWGTAAKPPRQPRFPWCR